MVGGGAVGAAAAVAFASIAVAVAGIPLRPLRPVRFMRGRSRGTSCVSCRYFFLYHVLALAPRSTLSAFPLFLFLSLQLSLSCPFPPLPPRLRNGLVVVVVVAAAHLVEGLDLVAVVVLAPLVTAVVAVAAPAVVPLLPPFVAPVAALAVVAVDAAAVVNRCGEAHMNVRGIHRTVRASNYGKVANMVHLRCVKQKIHHFANSLFFRNRCFVSIYFLNFLSYSL